MCTWSGHTSASTIETCLKSQHVVACFAVGRYLLRLAVYVWPGACLELLCELYGVGGRRRINCVEVEAILYIDKVKVRVRKKVLW